MGRVEGGYGGVSEGLGSGLKGGRRFGWGLELDVLGRGGGLMVREDESVNLNELN